MEFNWIQLFADFTQGLLKVIEDMNKELNGYIDSVDCDTAYTKTIAQIRQLDSDVNRLIDFINTFYEEKGLKKLVNK